MDEDQELLNQLDFSGPVEPFLVFADRLQARGDPWGELIAIACAAEKATGDKRAELVTVGRAKAPAVYRWCTDPDRLLRLERGFIRGIWMSVDPKAAVDQRFERDLGAILGSRGARIVNATIKNLGDRGVRTVVDHKQSLLRCTELTFADHYLGTQAYAALRAAFRHATFYASRSPRSPDVADGIARGVRLAEHVIEHDLTNYNRSDQRRGHDWAATARLGETAVRAICDLRVERSKPQLVLPHLGRRK